MAEGLRERSRVRRRAAIARAALKLFSEQGYETTTVAQVAEAAEVSPRTVSLYFPSKLDLALAYVADAADRLGAACTDRPPGASTLDIMYQWLTDEHRNNGDTIALLRNMFDANPFLRGAETGDITAARQMIAVELAADLGRAPDDPVVLLVNGALAGVIAALVQIDPESDNHEIRLTTAGKVMAAVVGSVQTGG